MASKAAETARLIASLEFKDNLSKGIRSAVGSLGRLEGNLKRSHALSTAFGVGLERVAESIARRLTGAVVGSVKAAGDFEAALNTINTVAMVTPDQLGAIGDSIRALAKQTGTSIDDLTGGYYDLVSAGIKAADAQGVLAAANTLAIGGLGSTAETIDLLTTAINSYGMEASQAGAIADQFAQAIAAGKVTASELAGSFAVVGSFAAQNKIEIGEVAAAYAQLTAKGIPAAEAATQMRSALMALAKPTAGLKGLQKETKKTYLAIAGDKGLVFALEEMRKDAEKNGVPLVNLMGRVEGLNFALATTGANFDSYNANLAAVGDFGGDGRQADGRAAEGPQRAARNPPGERQGCRDHDRLRAPAKAHAARQEAQRVPRHAGRPEVHRRRGSGPRLGIRAGRRMGPDDPLGSGRQRDADGRWGGQDGRRCLPRDADMGSGGRAHRVGAEQDQRWCPQGDRRRPRRIALQARRHTGQSALRRRRDWRARQGRSARRRRTSSPP